MVRAAAAAHTTLISAIGHEDDWTLLDLVADLRASTPTDAAKKVVPDVREQMQLINVNIERMRMRIDATVNNETRLIEAMRTVQASHSRSPCWNRISVSSMMQEPA